ncbi:hypothetical protein ACJA25_02190 [Mycoplasmopsis hyopharyngis]|uniref:hypothetical protein n=1 Tax=Mycoplasmopsis hyopharyngis TaxID=29558 RepID=UPI00387344F3
MKDNNNINPNNGNNNQINNPSNNNFAMQPEQFQANPLNQPIDLNSPMNFSQQPFNSFNNNQSTPNIQNNNVPSLLPDIPNQNNSMPSLYQAQEIAPYTGFTNLPTLQQPFLPGVFDPSANPYGLQTKKSKKNLIIGLSVAGALAVIGIGGGIGIWKYFSSKNEAELEKLKNILAEQIAFAKLYLADKSKGKEHFQFMDKDLKNELENKYKKAENIILRSQTTKEEILKATDDLVEEFEKTKKEHERRNEIRDLMDVQLNISKGLLDKTASDILYTEIYKNFKDAYYNAASAKNNIDTSWTKFESYYKELQLSSKNAENDVRILDQEKIELSKVQRINMETLLNYLPSQINLRLIEDKIDYSIKNKYTIETDIYANDQTGSLIIVDKFYKVISGIKVYLASSRSYIGHDFKKIDFDKYHKNIKIEPKNHYSLNKSMDQIWAEIQNFIDDSNKITDFLNNILEIKVIDQTEYNFKKDNVSIQFANDGSTKPCEYDPSNKNLTINYKLYKTVKTAVDKDTNKEFPGRVNTIFSSNEYYKESNLNFEQFIKQNIEIKSAGEEYKKITDFVSSKKRTFEEVNKFKSVFEDSYKKYTNQIDSFVSQANTINSTSSSNKATELHNVYDQIIKETTELEKNWNIYKEARNGENNNQSFEKLWALLLEKKKIVEDSKGSAKAKFYEEIWNSTVDGLRSVYDEFLQKAYHNGVLDKHKELQLYDLKLAIQKMKMGIEIFENKDNEFDNLINELSIYRQQVQLTVDRFTYPSPLAQSINDSFVSFGNAAKIQWKETFADLSQEALDIYNELNDFLVSDANDKTYSNVLKFSLDTKRKVNDLNTKRVNKELVINRLYKYVKDLKDRFFNETTNFAISKYEYIDAKDINTIDSTKILGLKFLEEYIEQVNGQNVTKYREKYEVITPVQGYKTIVEKFVNHLSTVNSQLFEDFKKLKLEALKKRTTEYFENIHNTFSREVLILMNEKNHLESTKFNEFKDEYEKGETLVDSSTNILSQAQIDEYKKKLTADNENSVQNFLKGGVSTEFNGKHKNIHLIQQYIKKIREINATVTDSVSNQGNYNNLKTLLGKGITNLVDQFNQWITFAGGKIDASTLISQSLNEFNQSLETKLNSVKTNESSTTRYILNYVLDGMKTNIINLFEKYTQSQTQDYSIERMNELALTNSRVKTILSDYTSKKDVLDKLIKQIDDLTKEIEQKIKKTTDENKQPSWKIKKFQSLFEDTSKGYNKFLSDLKEKRNKVTNYFKTSEVEVYQPENADSDTNNSTVAGLKNYAVQLKTRLFQEIDKRNEAFKSFELLVKEIDSSLAGTYSFVQFDTIRKKLLEKMGQVVKNNNVENWTGYLKDVYDDFVNKDKNIPLNNLTEWQAYAKYYYDLLKKDYEEFKLQAAIILGTDENIDWISNFWKEFGSICSKGGWKTTNAEDQQMIDEQIKNSTGNINHTLMVLHGFNTDLYEVEIINSQRIDADTLKISVIMRNLQGNQVSPTVNLICKLTGNVASQVKFDLEDSFKSEFQLLNKDGTWEPVVGKEDEVKNLIQQENGNIQPNMIKIKGWNEKIFELSITSTQRINKDKLEIVIQLKNVVGTETKTRKFVADLKDQEKRIVFSA